MPAGARSLPLHLIAAVSTVAPPKLWPANIIGGGLRKLEDIPWSPPDLQTI